MNERLLKILSDTNTEMDQQQLMEYINGKLSGLEKHDIEKMMADSDLLNDAVEGLQEVKNKKNIQTYVEQLNAGLQKSLQKKNSRRQKRKIKEYPWSYLALILVILLCMVAYVIVRKVLLIPSH